MRIEQYITPEAEIIEMMSEEGFLTLSEGSGGANGSSMVSDDTTFDGWD